VKAASQLLMSLTQIHAVRLASASAESARAQDDATLVDSLVAEFHTTLRLMEDLEILPGSLPAFPEMVAAFMRHCTADVVRSVVTGDLDRLSKTVVDSLATLGVDEKAGESVAAVLLRRVIDRLHPALPKSLRLHSVLE